MTERKPPGVNWESWIDRVIREGRDRGEFDNLPGAGRPLPDLDKPRDEMWWVKQLLRRENVAFTPPTLAIRKELEDAMELIAQQGSEDEVRSIIAAINTRIREVNSSPSSGPPSSVMPLDVDETVRKWRQGRAGPSSIQET